MSEGRGRAALAAGLLEGVYGETIPGRGSERSRGAGEGPATRDPRADPPGERTGTGGREIEPRKRWRVRGSRRLKIGEMCREFKDRRARPAPAPSLLQLRAVAAILVERVDHGEVVHRERLVPSSPP